MIVSVPSSIFWRRKQVLGMGITQWRFRMAVAAGRLKGTLLLGRVHCVYRRDRVMRAFGMRPCDGAGERAEGMRCGFVVVRLKNRKDEKA